jgi:hypothetical protein
MKKVTWTLRQLTVEIHLLNENRPQDLILKQENTIDGKSDEVIRVLQEESRTIRTKSGPVISVEVFKLTDGINAVQAATKEVTDAWLNAKPTILRLNGKQNVLSILRRSSTATDEFIDAIVSKLPALDKGWGQMFGQRSKDMLHRAIVAYQ